MVGLDWTGSFELLFSCLLLALLPRVWSLAFSAHDYHDVSRRITFRIEASLYHSH